MSVAWINGQSTSDTNLKKLLTNTGYFTNSNDDNDQPRNFGKWFRLDYGTIPNFISRRTCQQSKDGANTGWSCKKVSSSTSIINVQSEISLHLIE